jgi:hypothetical protein
MGWPVLEIMNLTACGEIGKGKVSTAFERSEMENEHFT